MGGQTPVSITQAEQEAASPRGEGGSSEAGRQGRRVWAGCLVTVQPRQTVPCKGDERGKHGYVKTLRNPWLR